jgi:3-methyladenine DNA glycosylase AlkD
MSAPTPAQIRAVMRRAADPLIAGQSRRFFKCGKGEYGEGDQFLGFRVATLRAFARQFDAISVIGMRVLLRSAFHEERLLALLMLVRKYDAGNAAERIALYRFYLANTRHVNNWDLVDSSAHLIVGAHLENRSRAPLYRLAKSASLWERRIAIIATFWFIRQGDCKDTLAIAALLLHDEQDLLHKAVGWMLREVGKRQPQYLRQFMDRHAATMPRTMLRYAIEKFSAAERARYLGRK